MILDHIAINVSDLERSRAFYAAALEPLGIGEIMARPGTVGMGRDGKPEFWLRERAPGEPVHVAFAADRPTVDAFHAAALAAGATDNGAPGVREMYHPGYYGAFVLDPDGHNIEAVCHRPPGVS
jgi:catechol 2,3-dioxygenase-like lactoylglutathione lyase family enzyme